MQFTTQNIRRRTVALAFALLFGLAIASAPMVLDGVAGTNLTDAAFACGHPSGGC